MNGEIRAPGKIGRRMKKLAKFIARLALSQINGWPFAVRLGRICDGFLFSPSLAFPAGKSRPLYPLTDNVFTGLQRRSDLTSAVNQRLPLGAPCSLGQGEVPRLAHGAFILLKGIVANLGKQQPDLLLLLC